MTILEGQGMGELSQFAMDVLKQSGDEAISYYGRCDPQLKFDEELVIEAELGLRDVFQRRLEERFPKHQLFMTNQNNEGYTHEEKRYLWVYDPLDGVANFQAGIPIWGISVSLMENFWPILGAFYMPASKDLFHAQADQKAFKGDQEIRVSEQTSMNDESLFLIYSRFHNRYRINFPGKIRNLGCTSAHICFVAMGRAEAAVIASESYRDLAAARVIIEAAGGKLLKMEGGELFLNEYLDGRVIETHMLAVSPESFSEIRQCIQEAP